MDRTPYFFLSLGETTSGSQCGDNRLSPRPVCPAADAFFEHVVLDYIPEPPFIPQHLVAIKLRQLGADAVAFGLVFLVTRDAQPAYQEAIYPSVGITKLGARRCIGGDPLQAQSSPAANRAKRSGPSTTS